VQLVRGDLETDTSLGLTRAILSRSPLPANRCSQIEREPLSASGVQPGKPAHTGPDVVPLDPGGVSLAQKSGKGAGRVALLYCA